MTQPLYRSLTRSSPISDLPTELRNALVTYAERNKLKLIGSKAWITHRENSASKTLVGRIFRRRANHADREGWHETVLVVHSTHLLFATHGDNRSTKVFSVPLVTATLTEKAAVPEAPNDDGIRIGGFSVTDGASADHFMGLGDGSEAAACVSAVRTAIADAKASAA